MLLQSPSHHNPAVLASRFRVAGPTTAGNPAPANRPSQIWDGTTGSLIASIHGVVTGFLALKSPRLPTHGRLGFLTPFAAAGLLHLTLVGVIILTLSSDRGKPAADGPQASRVIQVVLPRIVFIPSGPPGGGGGGGGNRQTGPVRHAEGVGRDAVTLRTAKPKVTADRPASSEAALPPIMLDARPLASGSVDVLGLPVGGVSFGTSTGPGSGGGVGTGTGTGIGPGRGPGIGPGSDGGIGGGVYRTGGGVTTPRLLSQVKPRYTNEALSHKIQGAVWLELVVTRDGRADQIRVVRSLDPGGLDDEAVNAARQWRFEPGRLAGVPVDVLVTVVMDFLIR